MEASAEATTDGELGGFLHEQAKVQAAIAVPIKPGSPLHNVARRNIERRAERLPQVEAWL